MQPRARLWSLVTVLVALVGLLLYLESRGLGPRSKIREIRAAMSAGAPQHAAVLNTCPVCGQRSVFGPAGRIPRPGARCNRCGTLERHRQLYLYLQRKTDLFRDEFSVLHFSPARGLARRLKTQANLHYVTSEYDKPADLQLDLTRLDLPDESWDVILCYHVFEHIPDDRAGMREMFRVLKPGGLAVVQVPVREEPDTLEDLAVITDEERVRLYGQADHVRYYGWKDFADRFEEVGFEVTIERFGHELSPEEVREYALDPNERIYLLRKPARSARAASADTAPVTDS